MKWDNPVAITKHPPDTGTFCIRLCTPGGARYQNHLERPLPIEKMLEELEGAAAFIRQHFTKQRKRSDNGAADEAAGAAI